MLKSGVDIRSTFDGRRAEYRCQVSYQQTAEVLPFPREVKGTRRVVGEEGHDEWTVQFGPPRELARRAEQFRLAYYGIPESVMDVRQPQTTYRWILINIAILIAVIAAFVVWRRMRQRANLKSGTS